MKKIAFIEPLGISTDGLSNIISKYIGKDIVTNYYDTVPSDKQEVIKRIGDSDVVTLAQVKIDKEIIDACKNLKYINIAFTGVDHVDVEYCKQKGIKVSNASGYSTVAVGDLTFGLILDLLRNIDRCDEATRASKTKAGLVGNELEGKTIGLIGAGHIGGRVANIAKAFGLNVLTYARHNPNIQGTTYTDLNTLLKESDIVSLHVPSSPETKGMIGEKQLQLMKNSAILINTARGPVVDNVALRKALENGEIAGAGIDVYDYEPPLQKDYCLIDAPNCILTPHVGFATKEAFIKRAHIVGENLKQYDNDDQINIIC